MSTSSNENVADKFLSAAKSGDYESVKSMLENGIDVNTKDNDGWAALMYAERLGYKNIVKLLRQYGAKG